MTPEEITKIYFSKGTRGHGILLNYYRKYEDLFIETIHTKFDDFLNQILLNVTKINFSVDIRNIEAYLIGTIKIQCRVQLDKAIKDKNRLKIIKISNSDENDEENGISTIPSDENSPELELDAKSLFNSIQYFKSTIKPKEVNLLNNLIDEIPRKEIAEKSSINMNTLDTQIRRLRIKMVAFLRDAGFEFSSFDKYE